MAYNQIRFINLENQNLFSRLLAVVLIGIICFASISCSHNERVKDAYYAFLTKADNKELSNKANFAMHDFDELDYQDCCKLAIVYYRLNNDNYYENDVNLNFSKVFSRIKNDKSKTVKNIMKFGNCSEYDADNLYEKMNKANSEILTIKKYFEKHKPAATTRFTNEFNQVVEITKSTLSPFSLWKQIVALNSEINELFDAEEKYCRELKSKLNSYYNRTLSYRNVDDYVDMFNAYYATENSIEKNLDLISELRDDLKKIYIKTLKNDFEDLDNMFDGLNEIYFYSEEAIDLKDELDNLPLQL